ncbi:hypothetical protein ACI3KW_10830 [Devosia sp. ZW T5_3]|uniref:hypothetical protein n=1 Tax=Devosia sp. ZW T5_3 TaxID=3378085 RepID=UPI0038541A8D
MSGSYRDDRPALIALGLTLAAIVFIAFFETGARYSVHREPPQTSKQSIQENAEGDVPQIVPSADDFSFWEDPFPQWAMAVLAAFATGASFWAIFEVRRTFGETRRTADAGIKAAEAAQQANAIAERGQRPYVFVENATTNRISADNLLRWDFTIKNYGASPAILTRIQTWTQFAPEFSFKEHNWAQDDSVSIVLSATAEHAGSAVLLGYIPALMQLPVIEGDAHNQAWRSQMGEQVSQFLNGDAYIFLVARVEYRDVSSRKFERCACFRHSFAGPQYQQYGNNLLNYDRELA